MISLLLTKISRLFGLKTESFNRYFKNTLWMFAERFFTMACGLLIGIAVARHIGPAQFGTLSYGLTLYSIGLSFCTLGLDDLIIRDALKHPKDVGRIYGSAFTARFTAAMIAFLSCTLFAYYTTDKAALLPVVIITASVLLQPVNLVSLFFQMKVMGRFTATANMYSYGIAGAIKVTLILINAPLIFFAIAMLLDTFIAVSLVTIFYHKNGFSFKEWRFDKKVIKYFFKLGWPLTLIIMLSSVYNKIDMLMVQNILGADALGKYAVAVRLTEVWYHIPAALAVSLFPAIINSKGDSTEYNSRLQKVLSFTVFGSLVMGLFVTFAAPLVVKILYGNAYADSAACLSIFIWCLLFFSMNAITTKWIMIENHIILGLYRVAMSMVVNIGLNYLLINLYGIKGAAAATVASFAFYSYFIDLFSHKTRGLFIIKTKALIFPATFAYGNIKKIFNK